MKKIITTIAIAAALLATVAQAAPLRVRQGKAGIVVVGDTTNTRAMSTFKGSISCLDQYAEVANLYNRTWDGKVNIYVMPIPKAVAVYGDSLPQGMSRAQGPIIDSCFRALDKGVRGVSILQALRDHADEPIYSRTDHHWAPLGAYYAAQQLAKAAGVPFKSLSHYDKRMVRGFVGTMAKWSGIDQVRHYPEDFVYYVPRDTNYTTTYIEYGLDKARRRVVKASEPHEGNFFRQYKDGSGQAYCTFMGGDSKLVKVETPAGNGRRLLIVKDSYGNALPGYLFYSFEQIHVVDCRYFTQNLTRYVTDNGITDIVLCNNIGHAATPRITTNLRNYLEQ